MAEEIVIGKLIIDTGDLEASMLASKKAIIDLENEQKKLKKDTDNLSNANEEQLKTFVSNENALKKARSEYSANQKSVLDLTKAQTGLDAALAKTVKTEDEAIKNNKELLTARRAIDTSTVEGAKAIEQLNKKMDENNEFILKNGNAQQKAATITGNYRQYLFGLGDAFEQGRTIVSGFTSTVSQASDDVTKVTNSLIQGTKATLGFKTSSQLAAQTQIAQTATTETQVVANEALTVSQTQVTAATTATSGAMKVLKIAIIGTGIGALVILGVALFSALKNNEAASNRFSKVLAGLKGIVNAVMSVLVPLGSFLIDKLAAGFDFAGQAAEKALGLISKGLSFIGLDKASKAVDKFTGSIKKSVVDTQRLADAEAKYNAQQRLSQKIQLDYQKQAEKLRQIRDDESKSTAQRIKANAQLGETLKKQQGTELAIANQAVAISNLRLKLEGKSKDNLDAQAEALTTVSDIQERISGQESEQLANLNSLRKEAADKEKARRDAAIEQQKKQLENNKLVFESEVKSVQQRLTFYEDYYNKLNKLEGGSNRVANAQALSSTVLAIAEEQINKELEQQKRIIEANKATTAAIYDEQTESAQLLAEAQIKLLDKRTLSEKAYADEVVKINAAKNEALTIIQTNFDEAEKVRRETNAANLKALEDTAFQIRLQDIADKDAAETEIKQQLRDEEYSRELADLQEALDTKLISNELYLAKLNLANKKYASDTKKNDKIISDQKKAVNDKMLTDGVGALQALFGESKAIAVAAALVNTYQGITAGVKLGYPAAIPAVAFAAATGFAAVKNILKTNKGSTGGGESTGTSSRTQSGTANFVNNAQTETVARVSDTPQQTNTVVTPPVLILETLMEAQDNLNVKMQSS